MNILIKNGRVIDPLNKRDEVCDLLIEKGKIKKIGKNILTDGLKIETIDAADRIVIPGLIDMHVHLRQPGFEYKETIETGMRAAAKGGFTSVCPMPNTRPVADSRSDMEFLLGEARRYRLINILPVGAVTVGQKGEELAEFGELKKGGAIALSDDGHPIQDSNILRRGLEYSRKFDLVILAHCEDKGLFGDGSVNEGLVATRLGLKGIPVECESAEVARDIQLVHLTRSRIHLCHISSEKSLDLIRQAKKENTPVTCETCPHYFTLTDEAVLSYNTHAKMNPPLRTSQDVAAVKEALRDGTIDVIATDHAPHAEYEKDVEFDQAPFGVIGLETSLPLSLKLVEEGILTLSGLVEKMSLNPARILKVDRGHLSEGAVADVTIIDLKKEWVVDRDALESKSKNTPFAGWKMKGKATDLVAEGRIVLRNGEIIS